MISQKASPLINLMYGERREAFASCLEVNLINGYIYHSDWQ